LHIERIEHRLATLASRFPGLARDIERAAQADAIVRKQKEHGTGCV